MSKDEVEKENGKLEPRRNTGFFIVLYIFPFLCYNIMYQNLHIYMNPVEYKDNELVFIGSAIYYHRHKRKISQNEMASILNISRKTYANREKNNRFTPEQLDIIGKRLNLNIIFTIQECN